MQTGEQNSWLYCFDDLPRYSAGSEIFYSLSAAPVPGYEFILYEQDLTGVHVPAAMNLQGMICWEDDNNAASLQPSCVTVLLLANGRPMASTLVSAEDFWVFSFSDLPVYENGREIFYSLQQEPVAHYQTACHGFVITNRLRSPEKDGTDVQIVSVFSD